MKNKHINIPIFVPNMGCGFNCIFCNQNTITNQNEIVNREFVENTIKEYTSSLNGNEEIELAFFGGSFTGIDESIQKELLAVAKEYKNKNIISKIRISTRPDYINQYILDYLKYYGVDIIELGVQSMDIEVLKASNRGHSSEDVIISSNLIKKNDFLLGLQMMVGLPKDSYDKNIKTAKQFIKLNPFCVRIYPALVIKNTKMEEMFNKNEFTPMEMKDIIYICKDLFLLFEYNNINVIRVGLQTTENINYNKDVIAGPFHPATRQIIESFIYRDFLESYFENNNIPDKNSFIKIYFNKFKMSELVGHKKINKIYFENKYNIKLSFVNINEDKLIVESDNKKSLLDYRIFLENYLKNKGFI